jgi:hypothetical protein
VCLALKIIALDLIVVLFFLFFQDYFDKTFFHPLWAVSDLFSALLVRAANFKISE